MTRHVIDTPMARAQGPRIRNYLKLKKAALPSRATLLLQRRARQLSSGPRAVAYARIERGYEA